MGTSAGGGGAGGNNPLIPSWIGGGGVPPPAPPPPNPDDNDDNTEQGNDNESDNSNGHEHDVNVPGDQNNGSADTNRYRQPRIQFNKFVTNGGRNQQTLKSALKGYSRNSAGGTKQMARRMQPAVSRVTGFYEVINTIRDQGKNAALTQFNLTSYQDKSISDILAALSDAIFRDTGKIYEDTQDDSINRLAYSNTVVRICELDGIDLDNLTNQQTEVMIAIFIEETIAQRVINDIGNMLTEKNTDIKELIEIESSIYQIVSGMVRNQIMPEIIATQRGDKAQIEIKVENIYRIAFDALAGLND